MGGSSLLFFSCLSKPMESGTISAIQGADDPARDEAVLGSQEAAKEQSLRDTGAAAGSTREAVSEPADPMPDGRPAGGASSFRAATRNRFDMEAFGAQGKVAFKKGFFPLGDKPFQLREEEKPEGVKLESGKTKARN